MADEEKQQSEEAAKESSEKPQEQESEYLDKIVKKELDTAMNSFKKRLDQVKGTDYILPKKRNPFKG